MTFSRHLKDSSLLLILLFSTLLRLFYWNSYQTIWWDSAVYLNIGRYVFSHGEVGFMEPLRPLALPFLLGASWKLGMNDISISRILGLIFSLLLITATYLLGKNENKEVATIAAIIISLSTIVFSFTFRNYTEIPAALLIILALWNHGRKNSYLAGVCAAFAFLFKFPAGIVLLALLVTERKLNRIMKILAAFALAIVPYLIINKIWYGSFFRPLLEGSAIIKVAGIWIFSQPWSFYLVEIFKDNFLHVFAIIGLFIAVFAKGRRTMIIAFILLFGYFLFLQHKEARFMILFLPLLAILTAVGINKIFSSEKTSSYIFLITLFAFFLAVPQTFDQY